MVHYSLVEGSSSAFNPDVKIVSAYKDTKIAFLGGELTSETIEKNQTVAVLVYTQECYCCYNLVCTTLPLMNINTGEDIGDENVPMEVTVFDNRQDAVNRVVMSSGNIRIRGGYSRNYPKLNYRFLLTTKSVGMHDRTNQISLLGMRQDDDWILYAAYNDQEKIRNVFSSNLWKYSCASDNGVHIDAGTEYKYLELFMNGKYWGLYALGYPIDKKQLGFGKDTSKEAIYEITDWVDVRNVILSEDGWNLLIEYYNNLNSNYEESEKLYEWMDIDNAIDVYLFINLIQGVDHTGKENSNEIFNIYQAIRSGQDGRLKGLYIPWDMDRTWGNGFNDIPYNVTPEYQVFMKSGYLDQIISNQDTDIWNKILDKYWTLRGSVWSNDVINGMIDEYETDIFGSGAYLRDLERWPDGLYVDPADKLDIFRQYVMERLAETDSYYGK